MKALTACLYCNKKKECPDSVKSHTFLDECFEAEDENIRETVALLSRQINVHKMKLNSTPFEMIKSGEKTIELRLYDEKRQQVNTGDKIVFSNNANGEILNTTVVKLHRFNTFNELYKSLPLLKCGYTSKNVDKATPSDMEQYYSVEEQNKYGVVGIELCRPKQITDEALKDLGMLSKITLPVEVFEKINSVAQLLVEQSAKMKKLAQMLITDACASVCLHGGPCIYENAPNPKECFDCESPCVCYDCFDGKNFKIDWSKLNET